MSKTIVDESVAALRVAWGQHVARARRSRGISQAELAEMAGAAGPSAITRIERGQRATDIALAVRVASALGISIDQLGGIQPVCQRCLANPPAGFTCNACGEGAA